MSASLIGHCCHAPCFLAFVVNTVWVTLFYVVGLVMVTGWHRHWPSGYQHSIPGSGKGYEAYETNIAGLCLARCNLLDDG